MCMCNQSDGQAHYSQVCSAQKGLPARQSSPSSRWSSLTAEGQHLSGSTALLHLQPAAHARVFLSGLGCVRAVPRP